ncbi:hypothetical protein [Kineococcus sp. SYSU DK003]|uniref:hypothetical protein n=1 Tax=Kineococcus sp. SYSU DK003 TaxID=3383124 RepID=UPI003D7E2E53
MGDFEDEELSAQERRVRALLRGSADVGPMPADVVARLEQALEQAREQTPVTSLAARRRRRLPRLVAAAAGVAVLGGGAVFAALDHTASTPVAAPSTEQVPPSAKLLLSGKDYADAAAVQDLAEDTLEEDSGAAAPDATSGLSGDRERKLLNAPSSEESATSDPSQRPAAERVLACTKQLGVDPDSVLSVTIASWRQEPAALVVHRVDEGAEVVVVDLDCTPGDEAYSRVAVPLPETEPGAS